MTPDPKSIEDVLLERKDWVSSEELCQLFGLKDDRPLRQLGAQPGLCTGFAISGDKGFKHVSQASTAEWLRFKHRIRKHGIQELVRVRDLDQVRHNVARETRTFKFECDTGQGLMAGIA